MKKCFLLLVAFLISTAAYSQNVIQLFNQANDFFALLQQDKFTEAHAYFDDTLKAQLSEESLKKLWGEIGTRYGKAQSLDAVNSKVQGEYFTVIVEGKFEKGDQNFLVGFNKTQKIVGLYLAPTQSAPTYSSPAYADTTKYTEQQVYLNDPVRKNGQLAAVITVPKNTQTFPVVVFVHGSGPNDMDETIGPNKPFKDIAAGLASQGIGSVRYVKRTLVHPGEFNKAYTVKEEVLDDAMNAIAMAKTVKGADLKNIYLFGHSLGGMLAPRIAAASPDLAGIILAAAPARKLSDLIIEQNKYFFSLLSDTSSVNKQKLNAAIAEIQKGKIFQLGAMKPDSLILGLPASYWVDLNNYDQVATAKKLTRPRMYVLQGGNDIQVTKTDYDLWNAGLSSMKNARLKFYPELNHLLSPHTGKTDLSQYQVPVSVSEVLVNDLVAWIKGQ